MIANQNLDTKIFASEQEVARKQANLKTAEFTQWKAEKGFL